MGYNPQSNGAIECSIGIVKDLMDKAAREKVDFQDRWFSLQNTPRTLEGMSPAKLFYSMPVREPVLAEIPDGRGEQAAKDSILKEKEIKNNRHDNENQLNVNPPF